MEWSLVAAVTLVPVEVASPAEHPRAFGTFVRPCARVSTQMIIQGTPLSESLRAQMAVKRPLAGVSPDVLFVAAQPVSHVATGAAGVA